MTIKIIDNQKQQSKRNLTIKTNDEHKNIQVKKILTAKTN